jgi:uncharacterized OB-fold protein
MTIAAVARDEATEEFFDGTSAGVYLIRRCEPHGHASKPQALQCSVCRSESLRWDPAGGEAKLISWAVLPAPASSVVAVAELAEGPWMWAALLCDDPAALVEGMSLRIAFERPPGSEAIPVLVPAGA